VPASEACFTSCTLLRTWSASVLGTPGCRYPEPRYSHVTGLCKVATIVEIEAQGWSLNPGRYVGTEVEDLDDEVFEEKLAAAHLELRELAASGEARGRRRSRAGTAAVEVTLTPTQRSTFLSNVYAAES